MTISSFRRRLATEHGFTMVTVMVGMLAVMLISVAAVTAAGGDIGLARYDQDDKQAYAAAEAGVNDYLGQLSADSDYWRNCTKVPEPGAVYDKGVTNADRKYWRPVPGSTAEYSIELIPRSKRDGETTGPAKCNPQNPEDSMLENGNIKIRVTGRAKKDNNKNVRTLNATFRPDGFLDFLYYTNLENQDPRYIQRTLYPLYDTVNTNGTTPPKLIDWAGDKCQRYWYGSQTEAGKGRGQMPEWKGRFDVGGGYYYPSYPVTLTTANELDINEDPNPPKQPPICGEINFISGDEVNGPFHSNDTILVSGNPSFGTPDGDDKVEVAVPDDGSANAGWRGSGNPTFNTSNGKLKAGAQTLKPPVTNQELSGFAEAGYSFTGQTEITLNGTQMTVKNNGTTTTKALPPKGVIYVGNGTCGEGYDPNDPGKQTAGCGDVRLKGNYSRDLTIAAANDIVVMDTTKKTTDDSEALLGLIADGFVRVWHPVNANKDSYGQYDSCDNNNSPTNIRIDAAILTLNGSFTVDNYWCGTNLGNLTVNGAIAQNHRGVVGRGSSGYTKKYNYNPDLKFRSPPYFLDPVQSAWRILRQGEQSPPCVKTETATYTPCP